MKKVIVLIIFYTLLFSGCEKNNYDAPGCIKDKIREFTKTVICDSGASVSLYILNGKNVYVFSDGSCGADLGAAVYSEDCYSLGFLGGITGNTIIQGVKFYDKADFVKRIWKN
ncbi:MAG: hypothetical protein A2X05_08145 [Bacteroidetes bacterium GWE2_41_25]|nr:MAG: hypothetical protein A2X03_00395 [Bacteroidetes bacterium GWA2_40_15]OFX93328.1 MAG: hypothetical protein A2X05_08145 [Bacteroidetes bacterium GWE2_41_25]OFX97783.1 MAG: hypothetical protein A2X06_06000 [Bacteroidetes bacterium GWC2_40_22]OFY60789.1 MAG: hypothetical protein A2X04_01490 [Bacteroidetes bacterium GWF2_41_9]HBH83791.1 hypothetical protein [Bacteroidales bacterium]